MCSCVKLAQSTTGTCTCIYLPTVKSLIHKPLTSKIISRALDPCIKMAKGPWNLQGSNVLAT